MQVDIENLSSLERKLKVTVPSEKIQQEMTKRIKELVKKVNLKGFRPGKTPESVIKMHYGQAVRQEVLQEVMWETLQQALEQEKIYPAGTPKVEVTQFKEDAALEYVASFEVYPEVKLASLEGVKIQKPVSEVKESDLDVMIQNLQKQNVKWNEVERATQKDDKVIIDFKGFIDDEAFKGGSAKNFNLVLGSQKMIPGFEDQLIGANLNQTIEIEVIFPQDYHAGDLAGKSAKFKVDVKKILEPLLPEVNEAFAKDLGVTDGTVEGLRQEVKENMEREMERRSRDHVKDQIVEKLMQLNKVEIPQSLIDREIERLQQQYQQQFKAQTGSKDAPQLPKEQLSEQAKKNVTIGLLISQWLQENEIKADPLRVKQRIQEIASGYHHPEEIINWYYGQKERLAEIEAAVLEEQAIETLLEHLNVEEKHLSYDEFMHLNTESS